MSATIKIPEGNDPFTCKINGVEYTYAAGSTVEVPDAVAELIKKNSANKKEPIGLPEITIPKEGKTGDVLYKTAYGAEWESLPAKELPAVTADDNGDVLTVVEGAWAKAAPIDSSILMVTYDASNTSAVTADKTFAEVSAAAATGSVIAFVTFGEDGNMFLHLFSVGEGNVSFSNVEVGESVMFHGISHTSESITYVEISYPATT